MASPTFKAPERPEDITSHVGPVHDGYEHVDGAEDAIEGVGIAVNAIGIEIEPDQPNHHNLNFAEEGYVTPAEAGHSSNSS